MGLRQLKKYHDWLPVAVCGRLKEVGVSRWSRSHPAGVGLRLEVRFRQEPDLEIGACDNTLLSDSWLVRLTNQTAQEDGIFRVSLDGLELLEDLPVGGWAT